MLFVRPTRGHGERKRVNTMHYVLQSTSPARECHQHQQSRVPILAADELATRLLDRAQQAW